MGDYTTRIATRLIVSALYNDDDMLERAAALLERKFGRIDCETEELEFLHTRAYVEEMGEGIRRRLFSFVKTAEANKLGDYKERTARIEEKLAERVANVRFRRVNLDPMILTASGLTVATGEDGPHRVCVGDGVYAEKALALIGSEFKVFSWTEPDFTEPGFLEFLKTLLEDIETVPAGLLPEKTLRIF
ncbi:MAG TPA: DUF4416 family protein [candidate division Zixibacteria bacterium]|nr:DUF4416 family protein [candidate division Zixibacteria bacterium]